jgi:PhnB protein
MPDGTIGHAEVRIDDSVIMVADAQGEDYKPMAAGIHILDNKTEIVLFIING